MDATLRLTDILARPALGADGQRLGRVVDLAIDHGERSPVVTAVAIRSGRAVRLLPWSDVLRVDQSGLVLSPSGAAACGDLDIARDVLDAQVVDIKGRRLARVGEIELAQRGSEVRVVAVDVGLAAVVRRLGFKRLAARLPSELIGWDGLHFATGRGHAVQIASPAAAVHHLEPRELVELISRLPPARGAEVLAAVPAERATKARRLLPGRLRRRFPMMRARKRAPS